MAKGNVRLAIDFDSMTHLLEWFEAAKKDGHVPESAEVVESDMLDTRVRSGGVALRDTYLVKNPGVGRKVVSK